MKNNNINKISKLEQTAFFIFGVTGDLTKRKLIPAIYELYLSGRIPKEIFLVGFARRAWSDEHLREVFIESVKKYSDEEFNQQAVDQLFSNTTYIESTFENQDGYDKINALIAEKEIKNVLFYLATPPDSYDDIIKSLGKHKNNKAAPGWTRIVVEKPYGSDLDSAKKLEKLIHTVFEENQIYRIDHYLGKETVQDILVLRFANGIFEPLWNRRYINHVQITVAETDGVGTRAGYYETAGVVRDMFQNHLMQLLALTAMEAPVAFSADCVRDEKVKVLRALKPYTPEEVVQHTFRAQYGSGYVDHERAKAYKDEDGVDPLSITETFLAAKLYVENWRWSGIPFYLRSGKRLPKRLTEISIQFKQVPLALFNWQNSAGDAPNVLVLRLQPDEGITLTFGAKMPGQINQIAPVKMEFDYETSFHSKAPEAYVRLIQDALYGDATLFTRSDEVIAQWRFTDRLFEGWKSSNKKYLPVYEAGTWGPPGADQFIHNDHHGWRNPES
jgi:glucose-6-phosphate 1-dehydrogenase